MSLLESTFYRYSVQNYCWDKVCEVIGCIIKRMNDLNGPLYASLIAICVPRMQCFNEPVFHSAQVF